MVTRLSASDASFYHLEDSATPMYVGTLSILRKPRAGLEWWECEQLGSVGEPWYESVAVDHARRRVQRRHARPAGVSVVQDRGKPKLA